MKIAFVIGRFQPFHNGHKAMIDKALEVADQVCVILGDTGCRPDFKNPWTVEERTDMIRGCYTIAENERLTFASVEDIPYDDNAWAASVRLTVRGFILAADSRKSEQFVIGFKKDATSFYLDLFPEWSFVEVDPVMNNATCDKNTVLSATMLRESFFGLRGGIWNWKYHVPLDVDLWLREWASKISNETFLRISAECSAVQKHNAEWDCEAVRKYGGPVIAAVDALLHTDDAILLIRRGGGVGKGALALPGGFVDPSERLVDAALRELHEETGIEIKKWMLASNPRVIPFDHPGRSMRGRIITNVLPINVGHLPAVKRDLLDSIEIPVASDDAAEALWIKKDDLPGLKREFFADHYHIIQSILN